jgi:tRNA(fMet)-specific endonuclease VapC
MPRYILDTNICTDLMKHQPPEVAERFAQCCVGDVVICAITLAELEYGVACSGRQQARNRKTLDALALGVTLVTNNLADFAAYPDLKVGNWVEGD